MLENQLSRYGAITKAVPYLNPGAKVFLVCDSDDTTVSATALGAEFPVDKDGVTRVYTTIQSAVNAASAGRGDVVLVLPGYDHTLGRADSWATAGVHVIGLGTNNARPIVRYGATTDEVGIAANNVHVKNIRFLAAADSIARAVDLDTGFSGAHIEECVFDFAATTNNFVYMMRLGQARSLIENCEFRAEDTSGCKTGVFIREGSFSKIRSNFFYGQFDTVGQTDTTNGGAIAFDSTGTVTSGTVIKDNTIVSTDTAGAVLLETDSALNHRGIVVGNRFATYDTASADTAQVDYGSLLPLQNKMITGDSDVRESIVGKTVARVFDSG